MGEIAEMMITGILCEQCGVFVNAEEVGYPVRCEDCLAEQEGADHADTDH